MIHDEAATLLERIQTLRLLRSNIGLRPATPRHGWRPPRHEWCPPRPLNRRKLRDIAFSTYEYYNCTAAVLDYVELHTAVLAPSLAWQFF